MKNLEFNAKSFCKLQSILKPKQSLPSVELNFAGLTENPRMTTCINGILHVLIVYLNEVPCKM